MKKIVALILLVSAPVFAGGRDKQKPEPKNQCPANRRHDNDRCKKPVDPCAPITVIEWDGVPSTINPCVVISPAGPYGPLDGLTLVSPSGAYGPINQTPQTPGSI